MRLPANLFRRVIALLVIAVGLFWVAFAIWLFQDTTDTARRILVDTHIMTVVLVALGTAGLTTIYAGVLLLAKKRHRASLTANVPKADK